MNLFSHRPLLLALTVFILTSVIAKDFSASADIFIIASLLLLLTAFVAITIVLFAVKNKHAKFFFNVMLCILFCTTAFINSYMFFHVKLARATTVSDEATIVARIDECTFSTNYTSVYVAKLLEINGSDTDFYIELSSNGPTDFEKGDIIKAEAIFSSFSESIYGFNEETVNFSDNILAHASFDSAERIDKDTKYIKYFFTSIRDSLSSRLDSDYPSSGIIKALFLGDKSDLESGTTLTFRRLGISHILSISGTHFTILLGMISIFLSTIGLGKKSIYFLLIPFALFYMGLTGFSESVCRAGIMAIISYSAFLLGRFKDSYTALAIAVAVILLASPNCVLSTSLWLSCIATFTILVIGEFFIGTDDNFKKKSLLSKILTAGAYSFLISIAVSVTTLPVIASIFGEISIISPVANVLIIPLFTAFMYVAPLCLLFPGSVFASICDVLYSLIGIIANSICSIDGLLVSLKQEFVLPISVTCIIITAILIALPLKHRNIIFIPPIVCIIALATSVGVFNYMRLDETKVLFFTEGQNDGFVITDKNETLCIDISTGSSSPAYRFEYISEECYSPEISAYMFTHYHAKHVNTFSKLVSRTRVHTVYLPISNSENSISYVKEIEGIATMHDIDVIKFEYGSSVEFQGCEVTVFSPIEIKRSTHPVINLSVTAKGTDVLYLGSSFSETDFEYQNLAHDAEYILFGQHNPVPKKEFKIDTNALTVYASEKHASLSKDTGIDKIMQENDLYEILLK